MEVGGVYVVDCGMIIDEILWVEQMLYIYQKSKVKA